MKTSEIGQKAESRVAEFLKQQNFKVLAQNWKTKVCEIDIVASKANIVYFIEVKYRSSKEQGTGIEYITAAKLHKMYFAAQIWVQKYNWNGDYRLLAASVSDYDIEMVEIN